VHETKLVCQKQTIDYYCVMDERSKSKEVAIAGMARGLVERKIMRMLLGKWHTKNQLKTCQS